MLFATSGELRSVNDPGRFIFIFRSEIERINRELLRRPSIETGGDLFGFWLHDSSPIVYCALGPGPNARHHATAFYQDVDWLEHEGRRLNDDFGLQHVGEWHSHHQLNLYHPSGGDVSTIKYAMNRHRFERFALVICNVDLSPNDGAREVKALTLSAYLFDRQQRKNYRETPWVVLPKQSPLSTAAENTPLACGDVRLRPRVVALDDLRGRAAAPAARRDSGPELVRRSANSTAPASGDEALRSVGIKSQNGAVERQSIQASKCRWKTASFIT